MKLILLSLIFLSTKLFATWPMSDHIEKNKLLLSNMVNKLLSSKSGKLLISKAKKKSGSNELHFIKLGKSSVTDSTLIRSFYPNSSKVTYEENTIVQINRLLPFKDAVLDLAHELTHFTYRKSFNPYKHNYKLKEFIARTIEGRGGEVDAFIVECTIRKELYGKDSLRENQCASIMIGDNFSREKAIKLFYQVGGYFSQFAEQVDIDQYQYLSSADHRFISSAYNVPYPIAAMLEFNAINNKICKTNKSRVNSFKKELRKPINKMRRTPSSIVVFELETQYNKRCL